MPSGRLSPLLLLAVAACQGFNVVPTDVPAPGMADADKALRDSIARVSQAMNEMGGKGIALRQPTSPGPYVPAELQRPVVAQAASSLDEAARMLARRVGYRFASNAALGAAPVPVVLPGQPTPLIDLFRALGDQAGQRAEVVVNADQRQVEVRHRG